LRVSTVEDDAFVTGVQLFLRENFHDISMETNNGLLHMERRNSKILRRYRGRDAELAGRNRGLAGAL